MADDTASTDLPTQGIRDRLGWTAREREPVGGNRRDELVHGERSSSAQVPGQDVAKLDAPELASLGVQIHGPIISAASDSPSCRSNVGENSRVDEEPARGGPIRRHHPDKLRRTRTSGDQRQVSWNHSAEDPIGASTAFLAAVGLVT